MMVQKFIKNVCDNSKKSLCSGITGGWADIPDSSFKLDLTDLGQGIVHNGNFMLFKIIWNIMVLFELMHWKILVLILVF